MSLSKDVIETWIAPIITGIIVSAIIALVNVILKKVNRTRYINVLYTAQERLLEVLRPFLIGELELNKDIIVDARNAILKEYKLEDKEFVSIEEIRQIIVLDILKTRFISEQDKCRLLNHVYKSFDFLEIESKIVDEKVESGIEDEMDFSKGLLKKSKGSVDEQNIGVLVIIFMIIALMYFFKYAIEIYLIPDSIIKIIITILLVITAILSVINIILSGERVSSKFKEHKWR